jgi:hypothetical protein
MYALLATPAHQSAPRTEKILSIGLIGAALGLIGCATVVHLAARIIA